MSTIREQLLYSGDMVLLSMLSNHMASHCTWSLRIMFSPKGMGFGRSEAQLDSENLGRRLV